MLTITVPSAEWYDERSERFYNSKEQVLQLEHSLVSISKWEAKWKKPFLGREEKTAEEIIDYIRCMTITQHVDPITYYALTDKNIEEVTAYIKDSRTATWFRQEQNRSFSREVVTSELIYYWMIALNIPVEFQKWHLNRLLTLIRVCQIKNTPHKAKKITKSDMESRRALNEARLKKYNTKG